MSAQSSSQSVRVVIITSTEDSDVADILAGTLQSQYNKQVRVVTVFDREEFQHATSALEDDEVAVFVLSDTLEQLLSEQDHFYNRRLV